MTVCFRAGDSDIYSLPLATVTRQQLLRFLVTPRECALFVIVSAFFEKQISLTELNEHQCNCPGVIVITRMITDEIGLHSILLPLHNKISCLLG